MSALTRAEAVLAELEAELDPHIDAFVEGKPDVLQLGCAAARIVGAKRVIEAIKAGSSDEPVHA